MTRKCPCRIGSPFPLARWAGSIRTGCAPRNKVGRLDSQAAEEEVFIVDDRSAMSAAQMVENKLTRILKDASLPVSHLQMRNLLRSR